MQKSSNPQGSHLLSLNPQGSHCWGANESCMHLFLRIQTLAQILGYRLFSLTYSSICLMARPEDLVLYKVMPTRDIVKCSSINMTNARLISNRKHKLPSQHKFSALSCRRADRVDSGRRLLETVCLKRIDTLAATGCDLSTYFRQEASHIHTQHIHTSPIGAHFGNKCAHWCKQRSVQGVH